MIFVYYSKNRELKEIITDATPNTGNSNVDHIYIYWENEDVVPDNNGVNGQLTRAGISTITLTDLSTTKVGKELPDEPERNLSYFSYDHTYEDTSGNVHTGYLFYDIPLPDGLFVDFPTGVETLLAKLTFSITSSGATHSFDIFPFSVKESGIVLDGSINTSQYKYLLTLLTSGTTIGLINDIATASTQPSWLAIPVDKLLFDKNDNVFYKKLSHDTAPLYEVQAKYLEAYDKNSVRGYKGTVSDLTDLKTDQYILHNNGTDDYVSVQIKQTDGTLKGLTIDKALGDKDGNEIDTTYLKLSGGQMTGDIDMNGKKILKSPDPVGNYQVANKRYVDAETTRAEGVEGGLNTRLGTAEGNITTLQQEVIRIEDSKNIADIVGTYAALIAYDVTKLRLNDIIEVLADESRPEPDKGGTTMYRLTQKEPTVTWTYIGIMHIPSGQLNNTYLRLDGAYAMTNNLNMGNKAIQNVTNPTNGTDATNKQTSEAYTNSKVFRIIDTADTYDLKIQIVGDDAVLVATER